MEERNKLGRRKGDKNKIGRGMGVRACECCDEWHCRSTWEGYV